jgi:VCBS repeat-containing protein
MRIQSRPKQLRRAALTAVLMVAALAIFSAAAGATNGKVLIVEDTVVGSAYAVGTAPPASVEAYGASLAGKGVDAVNVAQLLAMSTADVAQYDAVVLGDRQCATNMSTTGITSLLGSPGHPTKWAPAITGNVIVLGTDPVTSFFGGAFGGASPYPIYVIQGGIAFAAAGTGTGAYIDLSCYYKSATSSTHVDVLDPFGSFSVRGAPCTSAASAAEPATAHVVATHPAFEAPGWYDTMFSQWWVCSARETFDTFPADFLPVTILNDPAGGPLPGSVSFGDGSHGAPYIVARGSGLAPLFPVVPPANTAPVATDDSYSTDVGLALTVAAPGVLHNDTDAEANALKAVQVAGPSHGALTLNADGSFTYTPAAHYAGIDTFTYRANDGALDSNIATVTIIVNDNEPPAITCPANVTKLVDTGQSSAVVNYTVTATDNADGAVTISSNPVSGSAFAVGTTTVHATATDAAHNMSECSFTVTVEKRSTSTSIGSSVNPSAVGQVVTLTATVKSGADLVTVGTVRFHEGAVDLSGDLALNAGGQATLSISSLSSGSHTITVDYSGAGGYVGSSTQVVQVVGLRPTALAYTGPSTATLGSPTLTAKLTDTTLASGLGGKQVTFAIDGGAPQAASTNSAGVASFTPSVPLALGPHSIVVRFAGDGTYAASSASGTIAIVVNATGGGSVSGDDLKPATGGSVELEVKLQNDRGERDDRGQRGNADIEGEFRYVNRSNKLESKRITALTIAADGKSAWFSGVARDGRTFVVYVESGRVGRQPAPVLKLWIDGVLQTGTGALRDGSIKIKS